jgi:catechol 2,3-dioxygenase-like lactoylglutathione lyase family enzyme
MTDRAIPMLPSGDLDATEDFYAMLGFEAAARHPDYLILLHGELELHFAWLGDDPDLVLDPRSNFAGAYLRVQDADALHDAWAQTSAAERMDEIEDKPWGLREFHLVDPDGNLLRIGHIISNQSNVA